MTIAEPTEASLATAKHQQEKIKSHAIDSMGVTKSELKGWEFHFYDETNGTFIADMPLGAVDTNDMPTDPERIDEVHDLLEEAETLEGGTGQRDACVVCHVKDEGFFLVDGFHRHKVQTARGKTSLRVKIIPNCSYDDVTRLQVEYTRKQHKPIEFSRIVDIMQKNWLRTEWAGDAPGKLPTVLLAFNSTDPDYWAEDPEDQRRLEAVEPDTQEEIDEWVAVKSEEWGYSPAKLRENLALADGLAPDLVQRTLVGRRLPEGYLRPSHGVVIAKFFPGDYVLQRAMFDVAASEQLSIGATELVAREVEDAATPKALFKAVGSLDLTAIKAQARAAKKGQSGRESGADTDDSALNDASFAELLNAVNDRLANSEGESLIDDSLIRVGLKIMRVFGKEIVSSADKGELRTDLAILQEELGTIALQFARLGGVNPISNDHEKSEKPLETQPPSPNPQPETVVAKVEPKKDMTVPPVPPRRRAIAPKPVEAKLPVDTGERGDYDESAIRLVEKFLSTHGGQLTKMSDKKVQDASRFLLAHPEESWHPAQVSRLSSLLSAWEQK